MMFNLLVIVASVCFCLCDAAFVDILHKCSDRDEECLKNLLDNVLKEISENGVKEYDIEPIDGLSVKDINLSLMNMINISIVEATVRGFKSCAVTRFDMRVDKGKTVMDAVCDVNAKGKYKMSGVSPAIETLFGSDSIRGEGNFDANLIKFSMTLNFYFYLVKDADGDIFYKFDNDKFRFKYNGGDGKITIDNVFLGGNDASDVINTFMNQNFQTMIKDFGGPVFDVAADIVKDIVVRFFNRLPTKNYIIEDLSPYVKNDK